jgi:hypothetical protein
MREIDAVDSFASLGQHHSWSRAARATRGADARSAVLVSAWLHPTAPLAAASGKLVEAFPPGRRARPAVRVAGRPIWRRATVKQGILMRSHGDLTGLIKFLARDDWKSSFEEVLGQSAFHSRASLRWSARSASNVSRRA